MAGPSPRCRAETAPHASVREDGGGYALGIKGNGDAIADGRWVKRVALPNSQYVNFTARYRASNIEMAARNVVAGIVWLDENGKEVAKPNTRRRPPPPTREGWRHVNATLKVPPKAKQAQMELRLRWSPQGKVEWRDARAESRASADAADGEGRLGQPPPARTEVVAGEPRQLRQVDRRSRREEGGHHLPARGDDAHRPRQRLPRRRRADPRARRRSSSASSRRSNNTYIVAGLLERDGKAAYNTSVLIDRDGKLVGKYRKICLPRSEYNGGLAPGSEYPVFDTDFGKVGMMICWDVAYPEDRPRARRRAARR